MQVSSLLLVLATAADAVSELSCPKGTLVTEGGAACEQCPEGQFSWRVHSQACDKCPSGSTSNAARTSCSPCPAGTFNNHDSSACQRCLEGEFTARPRAVKCFSCPAGTTSEPLVGGTQCVGCSAGRFSEPNNEGCFDCPDGHFAVAEGSAKCGPCLGGAAACDRETGKVEVEVQAP